MLTSSYTVRSCVGVLSLLAVAATTGCATSTDATETSEGRIETAARNEDVQVLKVYNGQSFTFSKNSIYERIDQEACNPEGTTWTAIKAHDTASAGWLNVTLDCTDAVAAKFGIAPMRAIKVSGSRTKISEEGYYGYVGFSNSAGSFWSKTVELVVKQSAIDAPTFNGVGFYLNAFSYRYYEARPAPGANNGNAYFQFAAKVRAEANAYPAVTLASGEKARVIKVMLPSEYASGGTSSVPAFYFRPFAEYGSGVDKHQRWDSVVADYFVGTSTDFNREGDVLRH